ncbi:MAG: hypothetical protein HZC36_10615 [Armatimonadetes bacterium]|nr:hypothetical protein [Armatimonadota bacterium]
MFAHLLLTATLATGLWGHGSQTPALGQGAGGAGAWLAATPVGSISEDPVQTEWKRRIIAWAKMSAELPADPQKVSSEIRPGTIKNLESQQAGRLQHGGMIFRFAYNEYAVDSDVDLEMAAQGALGNLKATTGITELRFKRVDLKSDGVPGIRLETWYQFQAKPVSYWIVIYGERNRLWQASAMFRTADAEQEGLARRVLDSVRVDRT